MRHGVYGRKLSRNTNERKQLLVNLTREMFVRGRIKTTEAKAKAVRPMLEKLVTRAKKSNGSARLVMKVLPYKEVVKKLLNDAQTRFAGRKSGYTKIVRLGPRAGDNTEEVILAFVDEAVVAEVIKPEAKEKEIAAPKKETKTVKKPVKKSKTVSKK